MTPNDTVVACLTPPGTGAIATLAVRGPHAWPVVREIFQTVSNRPLPEDALAVARRQGRLHRNFQGYSTRPDE